MSEPAWVPLSGVASGAPLVTALPASPLDGQEVVLTDSLTAPTYTWRLRYVAAKATNRWVFVGGAPFGSDVATSQAVTATSYVALVPAQEFTVPVAGLYDVLVGCQGVHAGTDDGYLSYAIGATAASDVNAAHQRAGGGAGFTVSHTSRISAAASDVLAMRAKVGVGTWTIQDRRLRVTPVAVDG